MMKLFVLLAFVRFGQAQSDISDLVIHTKRAKKRGRGKGKEKNRGEGLLKIHVSFIIMCK